MAAWLSHGVMASFRERVFQEDKVECMSFLWLSCGSIVSLFNYTLLVEVITLSTQIQEKGCFLMTGMSMSSCNKMCVNVCGSLKMRISEEDLGAISILT